MTALVDQPGASSAGDDGAPDMDAAIVRALLAAGEELPYEVRDDIVARRRAAVPTLVAVARGLGLGDASPEAGALARLHAVDILRDIGDPATIEPLLALLAGAAVSDGLRAQLVFTLRAFGERVLELALHAYAATDDAAVRSALAMLVARLGVRDERVLPVLFEHLGRDPASAAICLADYGDPRAIAPLHQAFAAFDASSAWPGVRPERALFAIESSLQRLGASLTAEERDKYRQLAEAEAAAAAREERARVARARTEATRAERATSRRERDRSKKKRKSQRASRKKNR